MHVTFALKQKNFKETLRDFCHRKGVPNFNEFNRDFCKNNRILEEIEI